jgi:hypothetical protein
MNVVLLLKKYFLWKIRKITLVTKIKNCVTGITKRLKPWGKSRTGLGLGLSLLRPRERRRPAGVSLDVEMMSVLSTLASIQD